nr:tetratricopeptide repeat protein [Glycomyces amatae]
MLRELRAASGLSIREISRRARDRGDWLPTSTLAAVLNRDAIPRAEVVAALVRACGGDEAAVDTWLAQCGRIAAADVTDTGLVPRQLPSAPHAFIGRERELRLIDRHAREASPRAVVIAGPAGVGKTALALHWAHRSPDAFPDGQLYIDLRGFSGSAPLGPAPVLQRFLTALGTDPEEVPQDGDERAAMYRSLLSHRRVLVVLDNALSPEQLRDLLPGAGGSTALITARTDLFGLTATHGVPHLRLAPLTREASMDLLGAMIGRERVAADPEATRGLAAACGDLPLALRLAACQTLARPEQPLGDLRDRIAGAPLANLDLPGDEAAGLRACLDLTRDRLEPAERRVLDAVGLHPATEFEPAGIAALTGTDTAAADAALHRLAAVHLAAPAAEGRWSVHDLVRAYAREQAERLPGSERDAALDRLYDWYLATLARCHRLVHGFDAETTPDTDVPVPEFGDSRDAVLWLDARHDLIGEMMRHAAAAGHPWHAGRLAATMWRHLSTRGFHTEALANLDIAFTAARALGDRAHEARLLRQMGNTLRDLNRYDEAERRLDEARGLSLELGHGLGAVSSLAAIGWCHFERWRLAEARACAAEAAEGYRDLGEAGLETKCRTEIAHLDMLLGAHGEAKDAFEGSLKIFTDLGWHVDLGGALLDLGRLRMRADDLDAAAALLEQALDAYNRSGNHYGLTVARSLFAWIQARRGRRAEAAELAEAALDATATTARAEQRLIALNEAGFAYLASGDPDAAERLHLEALELAEALGNPYEEARARHGLGDTLAARGDQAGARTQWERALHRHEALGTYERLELADRLG